VRTDGRPGGRRLAPSRRSRSSTAPAHGRSDRRSRSRISAAGGSARRCSSTASSGRPTLATRSSTRTCRRRTRPRSSSSRRTAGSARANTRGSTVSTGSSSTRSCWRRGPSREVRFVKGETSRSDEKRSAVAGNRESPRPPSRLLLTGAAGRFHRPDSRGATRRALPVRMVRGTSGSRANARSPAPRSSTGRRERLPPSLTKFAKTSHRVARPRYHRTINGAPPHISLSNREGDGFPGLSLCWSSETARDRVS